MSQGKIIGTRLQSKRWLADCQADDLGLIDNFMNFQELTRTSSWASGLFFGEAACQKILQDFQDQGWSSQEHSCT
jgi:hypothetical protein